MSKTKTKNNVMNTKNVKNDLKIPAITLENNWESTAIFNGGHISKLSSQVKVSDLIVDYSYQRNPIPKKVKKIVESFNPDLLGVIICSMRENGEVAVIDGSHRYHALMAKGYYNMSINALVYFGLSHEQEANIFAMMNGEHTKPYPADIFKAGLVSGDELSLDIARILAKHNLNVSPGNQDGSVRAVGTLKRVYNNAGAEVLDKTLETIKLAFGTKSADYRDQLISAIGFIYNRYGNRVNQKRLAKALQSFGSSKAIIALAQSMNIGSQLITFTVLPTLIVNKYNLKLRAENKLEAFPLNMLPQQIWAKA
jgi:hypothetical protein